jgi:hypothetical protein
MPIRRAVLMIRQAISPRLAIRIRLNISFSRPRAQTLCVGKAYMSTSCGERPRKTRAAAT